MRLTRFEIALCSLSILMTILGGSTAFSAPLKVEVIPWVQGEREVPHLTVRGALTSLQAIAEDGECQGRYSYRWDINGDGDFADPNEGFRDAVSSEYGGYFAPLPLDVQLPEHEGDLLYLPTVEVNCAAETVKRSMRVLSVGTEICEGYIDGARTPNCQGEQRLDYTRNIYTALALDRAMWAMFLNLEHQTGDGFGHPAHLCTLPASKPMYALGHALTVFNRRGHGQGVGHQEDPYFRHATECGLNALLSTMSPIAVSFADEDQIGTQGQALEFSPQHGLSSQYWFSYESTAWVEPIALFGARDYVAQAGTDGVFGRNLRGIAQDLADALINCMGQDFAWSYVCAAGVGVSDDASSDGWAPEALRLLARAYDIETYQAAKSGQKTWLATHCPQGICTYHGGGPKLSGNALVGYGWVDEELFDEQGPSGEAWQQLGAWYDSGEKWGLYFVYAAVKGLRSFTPEVIELPRGVDLTRILVDFFITGEDADHIDLSARQSEEGTWNWLGDWVWGDAISTWERTAIVAQLLQTWLEVFPYARAFPQEIGPGESVTFEHSWSHSLNGEVDIVLYEWDVASYIDPSLPACAPGISGCQDLNGDGDCADLGERCNEDRNGDGLVTNEEIFWEFETADSGAVYTHTYGEAVDWGQQSDHVVTLRVTDSNDRVAIDYTSVHVSVSLENHPPIPIAHPEGPEVYYVGHLDSYVTFDGRASYDPDTARDPYPGDASRPAGIRDSITSIDYDLNRDGDFDDPGESGLNRTVRTLFPEDVQIGEVYTVPIRVCDDGQWSDRCLDGRERADCSSCAYGQAFVEFIPNQHAPVIDTCPQEQDCQEGYRAEIDGDSIGVVPFDLSETYDPDGDLGLIYHYELLDGEGSFVSTGDFAEDMGATAIYQPEGEGERVDRILVTVTDSEGLSSEEIIEVYIPNITPQVTWGDFDVQVNPPLIIRAEGRNEWSGRFRVVVDARAIHGAGVVARPITRDAGDVYQVYLDYDDDGIADQEMTSLELQRGAESYQVDDGYSSRVNVWCIDDDGAESNTATLQLDVPSKGETLIYRFDVGDDGSFEEPGTLNNFHEFFENDPNLPSIPIAIEVIDELGATSSTRVEVSLLNRPPIFIQTTQIEEGYSVTFVTSATDPDLDRLTYSFRDGNEGEAQVNESGVFVASYPAEQASYQATVTVSDGRGGEETHVFTVSFLPPVDLPPVIDLLSASASPGGESEAIVEAYDPEGQQISVNLDWGDGADPSRVVGGRATRQLSYREAPYLLTATVTDPGGQEDRALFSLQLVDAPTVISSAQQSLLSTGERMLTVIARDLDSPQLQYFWDYDGDGIWDDEATAPNIATHLYPSPDAYRARVGVRDPWSGVITEVEIEIPSTEPLPPVIINLTVDQDVAGHIGVSIEAFDPEGERLEYTVLWGDQLNEVAETIPLGIGHHQYALRDEPYVLRAIATDPSGLTDEREILVLIEDAPTEITGSGAWIEGTANYTLEINARDADSQSLTYYWDLNNDGQWDLLNQQERTLLHRFDHVGPYVVRFGARDPWSGEIAESTLELEGNLPPLITDIRLAYTPRGHCALEIDAFDPEGTRLSYQVYWGDSALNNGDPLPYEPLERDHGSHRYDYSPNAYRGRVRVTDEFGLSAEADFFAEISDSLTQIRELNITRLNGGEVELRINASDLDSPDDLRYSFDVDASGMWSPENQREPLLRFGFDRAGQYPIKVRVLDPWSGHSTQAEVTLNLPAWVDEAINEDHVIGDEGACIVFRVGEGGGIDSKVDPSICEDPSLLTEEERQWLWRFGDGDAREGVEVGHRYRDDGVYLVELQKRDPGAPLRSTIQAYVSNVAPTFSSEPLTEIVAGQLYEYLIEAEDVGVTDELKLDLVGTPPQGMSLQRIEGQARQWRLSWQSPELAANAEALIELRLTDGHMREGEDREMLWTPDGGEAYQRFVITVSPTPFDPFAQGNFAGTGHGPDGCDQGPRSPSPFLLILLGFFLLYRQKVSKSSDVKKVPLKLIRAVNVLVICISIIPLTPHHSYGQDLQLFTPAAGDWNYINLDGGQLAPAGKWAISSAVSYGSNPLVVVNENGQVQEVIVDFVSGLELSGALGITDWLELGLHLPYLHSSGLSRPYPVDDANGSGDMRLSTKFGLYQPQSKRGFSLALNLLHHIPGGDGERSSTRRRYSVEGRLSAEYRGEKWRVALNGGYRHLLSEETLTQLDGSSFSSWGLGGIYQVKPALELISELHQRLMTLDRSPAEALLAVRIRPKQDELEVLSVTLGTGLGVGTDIGSVGYRLFGALTYRPGDRTQAVSCSGTSITAQVPSSDGDQDQDGISDRFDRCPKLAEDHDGFEDTDGCPDTDNDQDGIADSQDQCPMRPEIFNEYKDEDGCPDQVKAPVQETEDEHADEGQLLDITERVFFKHNESILLEKSFPILDEVASLLKKYPQIEELRVEGHTDDTGKKVANQELSRDRAAAVRTYLISKGISPSRLVSQGYGDSRPIASNDTDDGRALNRRVNFRITKGPQEIFVIENRIPSSDKEERAKQPTPPQVIKRGITNTKEEPKEKPKKEPKEEPKEESKEEPKVEIEKDLSTTAVKKSPQVIKKGSRSGTARYSIQVKASTRLKDAQQVTEDLDKQRFKNYTLSHRGKDKKLVHRVRLGPYKSRQEAEEVMARYQDRFPKAGGCFIIKVSKKEAKSASK